MVSYRKTAPKGGVSVVLIRVVLREDHLILERYQNADELIDFVLAEIR